jgi:NitT/TauT family transport system substrate-binding protein
MPYTRRQTLGAGLAAALLPASLPPAAKAAEDLQKIRFGIATKAVSPIVINILIPEYLGYYRAEGLTVESFPLGSIIAAYTALVAGRVEFAVEVAESQLELAARGEKIRDIDFFEYTYPFKWAMAVKPGSPYHKLADLKGKRIGVSNLGTSDYPVGKLVLTLIGLDPNKDVSWLAVGEGVPAGVALQRGDIDALFYYDTGFGTIEAAGIPLVYLPLPASVPKVGGIYLATRPDYLRTHRATAVGFARAVAKAQVFIQTNPQAAAYVFTQMFPEAVPKGKSVQEQVKAIMVSVVKRLPLYASYDKSMHQWGTIKPSEWQAELKFAGLEGKIPDLSIFYTNDLIADINNFNAAKVKQEARAFKLPYKT